MTNKPIIIKIDNYTITIEQEKEVNLNDTYKDQLPKSSTNILNNNIQIKRIYYKKGDPNYHRSPIGYSKERIKNWTTLISKFSKFDKIVKQEPLPDFHC